MISPEDFSYLKTIDRDKSIQERVFIIARNIELNIKVNLTINNMVSTSYGFLRNGLICLLLTAFFVCAISYMKVVTKQTVEDEIRPIIESCVSGAFDNLKSEKNVLNEKIVSLMEGNKSELQHIQNILDIIQTDVTALERHVNDANILKKKSKNTQLKLIVK